jgi:Fur family ferric uptake transcriptional regulator
MTTQTFFDKATECLRQKGARVTPVRLRVLAFLLAQNSAVTHRQIELVLGRDEAINRVTLYRTLDWLTEQGLAHKVSDVDRVWHFQANEDDLKHRQHAHFKCNLCAKVICLNDLQQNSKMPPLPEGYRGMEVDLTVKGLCAQCARLPDFFAPQTPH